MPQLRCGISHKAYAIITAMNESSARPEKNSKGRVAGLLVGLLAMVGLYHQSERTQADVSHISYSESQNAIDYLQTIFAEYGQYARENGEFEKNGVYFGYEGEYFYIQHTVQNAGGYGRTRISFGVNGKPVYFTHDGAVESELRMNDATDSDHYTRSTRAIRYNFQTGQFYTDSQSAGPSNTKTEQAVMQRQFNRMLREFAARVKELLQAV